MKTPLLRNPCISYSSISSVKLRNTWKKDKGGSTFPMMDRCMVCLLATGITLPKPPGMVYVPQGTFHMGPSDEDLAYAFSARNKSVSISGFWMDATEITNNEYRQFVFWVRDSVVAKKIGYVKSDTEGNEFVDQAKMKTLKWDDPKTIELLGQSDILSRPMIRIFGKKEIDPSKVVYQVERFNLKEAAKEKMQVNPGQAL